MPEKSDQNPDAPTPDTSKENIKPEELLKDPRVVRIADPVEQISHDQRLIQENAARVRKALRKNQG